MIIAPCKGATFVGISSALAGRRPVSDSHPPGSLPPMGLRHPGLTYVSPLTGRFPEEEAFRIATTPPQLPTLVGNRASPEEGTILLARRIRVPYKASRRCPRRTPVSGQTGGRAAPTSRRPGLAGPMSRRSRRLRARQSPPRGALRLRGHVPQAHVSS